MKIISLLSLGIGLIFMGLLTSCDNQKMQTEINLKNLTPVVLKQEGTEIFQYWEFKNDSNLWTHHFKIPANIKSYKDTLENIFGKDSFNFHVQKMAYQDNSYQSVQTLNGDSINAQLVHSKMVGKIRPMQYLEAQLLDYQLSRYPLFSWPTEFHGFILTHDSLKLVKVYFAASDQPWPPKPNVILERLVEELKQGWTFKYHLHNHYEPRSSHYLGILAPSMADAQFYQFLFEDFNLENALITNGFHTVEINKSEFSKFKAHGNE
ncbi:MAG: hypothetical protein IPH93_14440 [Saprospiraceae bacterium]|nr:hypothetical protein [Saprospiraceae bacterium]MBK7812585.1 hypothetical protein [Saprospiraceae bacterium]MBK9630776.1 hypothetical protein [Saprospiraceae bacterium]